MITYPYFSLIWNSYREVLSRKGNCENFWKARKFDFTIVGISKLHLIHLRFWSDSLSIHCYINLSGHSVDAWFLRKNVVLNVKIFPESRTGNVISDIFTKWKMPEIERLLIICDNVCNIRLGAELSNLRGENCFIHIVPKWCYFFTKNRWSC